MKLEQKYPRSSGVLLHVTMLNSPFGIGTLGKEALEFVDFLHEAGFHAWQVLPVEQQASVFLRISAYLHSRANLCLSTQGSCMT